MLNSQQLEAKGLDKDLEDFYKEWGTSNLFVKVQLKNSVKDDVYDLPVKTSYSKPLNILGSVKLDPLPEKSSEGLGNVESNKLAMLTVLRSSLEAHNIQCLNTKDKVILGETEFSVLSVTPSTFIGTYPLQYKIRLIYSDVKGLITHG